MSAEVYDTALLDRLRRDIGDNRRMAYPEYADLHRLLRETAGVYDDAVELGLYQIAADRSVFDNAPSGFSVTDQKAMADAAATALRLWRARRTGAVDDTDLAPFTSSPLTYRS